MVLCPEGATGLSPGLGFSIFDIFAPTRESEDEDELEYEYDWGDFRTIGRKEKRAIEHQIFLEISSSYLVFVLQSYSYSYSYSSSSSSSTSAVAGQGENLQQIKLALQVMTPDTHLLDVVRKIEAFGRSNDSRETE